MNSREGDAKRVEVRRGSFTKVTMTSRGSAVITGTVVEHVTRMPVPDLFCHVVLSAGDRPGITNWDLETAPKTDATGSFSVDPSPAGEVHVSCMGDWREYTWAWALVTVARGGRAAVAMEVVKRVARFAAGDIGLEFHRTTSPVVQAVRTGSPAVPTTPLDAAGVEALIGNHLPGTQVSLSLVRGTQRRDVALVTVPGQP